MQPQQENSDHLNNSHKEIKQARTRAAFSICLNLILALGKGAAGIIGGSSALIGDAVHSGTDVIASSAAFVGLWLAGKQHPSFPYGLYKAETIATLAVSIAIILAGYEIGRQALLGPETLPDIALTLPVALLSLIITFAFGFYQLYQSKRLHSKALEADARDYLVDGLSTFVVVFSLISTYMGLNLDRWAAGAVSLFIFWSGGHLLWCAVLDLMDEAIDRDTERKIIALMESHPRVEKVEKCLSRMAGGRFIIDIDVVIRTHSHDMAHRISHNLEKEICINFPGVVMARVKTHSSDSLQIRRVTPIMSHEGPVAVNINSAPWFLLETIEHDKGTVDMQYFQNPHLYAATRKGYLVGKWLLGIKPDQIIVLQENEGTTLTLLKEAGVEIVIQKRDITN